MKRRFFLMALWILLFGLVACSASPPPALPDNTADSSENFVKAQPTDLTLKGVWIEYSDALFQKVSETVYRERLTERLDHIKEAGFNTVFLHVRANADAMYPSSLFPFAVQLTGTQGQDPGFDPLAIAVEEAHRRGLFLHAWVNPYRVSASSEDIAALAPNNPARIWKEDSDATNDSYVIPWSGQLYFNPSCPAVQKLILDGIQEILDRYAVDGIHFDDYFYPVSDSEFDIGSYLAYCRKAAYPLSQGDWRRANVDALVTATHRLVAAKGKIFGISPASPISDDNTDRNYIQYGIHVKKWMRSGDYVDYLAPQLYFGYNHSLPDSRFDALLSAWTGAERCSDVALYIGLAAYKIGLDAGLDGDEWATEKNILARQYKDCTAAGVGGIIVYNYSSLFGEHPLNTAERKELIKEMNGD